MSFLQTTASLFLLNGKLDLLIIQIIIEMCTDCSHYVVAFWCSLCLVIMASYFFLQSLGCAHSSLQPEMLLPVIFFRFGLLNINF